MILDKDIGKEIIREDKILSITLQFSTYKNKYFIIIIYLETCVYIHTVYFHRTFRFLSASGPASFTGRSHTIRGLKKIIPIE